MPQRNEVSFSSDLLRHGIVSAVYKTIFSMCVRTKEMPGGRQLEASLISLLVKGEGVGLRLWHSGLSLVWSHSAGEI